MSKPTYEEVYQTIKQTDFKDRTYCGKNTTLQTVVDALAEAINEVSLMEIERDKVMDDCNACKKELEETAKTLKTTELEKDRQRKFLQEANNRAVEARRAAERELATLRTLLRDVLADDISKSTRRRLEIQFGVEDE